MDPSSIALLLGAGLAAGFIAGLIGVGGGVIFAPVLFFYYQASGVAPELLAPLTIGSSLFCTLVAAIASAWFQLRRDAVERRVALQVGLFSAVVIFLMTRFVTTQPWYDGTTFQIVFSAVLLVVVARMVWGQTAARREHAKRKPAGNHRWPVLAGTGTVAGAVAAAAGVGGGVVLVPAYNNILRLPIHLAVGTSSATIVLISLVGIINYAIMGWSEPVPPSAIGYVDAGTALLLAVPAVVTARIGVRTAHRINRKALRLSFAAVAALVAIRLLVEAIG